MIHFIFGRAGSGKTSRVCEAAAGALSRGRRVFLLVPEQMAVDAEKRMADMLGDQPSLALEILNFRRLTNRVFREYGGLSYNYISKSGRMLLMWQTLTELAPILKTNPAVDRAKVAKLLGAISEFKAYRITPMALERAMGKLSEDTHKPLYDKLSDLSLIFASYVKLVAETCDDAADDLTKAAELLSSHDFFADCDVCLDSFNGYTPQEFAVIAEIFKQASNVTISLSLDVEDSRRDPFENQRATANELYRMARSTHHEIKITRLTENHRAQSPELRYLESALWSLDLQSEDAFTDPAPSLSLIECPSLFAECEAVAIDICRRVREGAKWRDFSVTTRGIDRYDGILDVIFEKYGIPYFLSRRTDIKSKPLIKFILTALSLHTTNFRTVDLISYIKTGLSGITPDEVSLLENYAETWKIRGAARWSEDFEMNPEGYTSTFTEESARRLTVINEIRARVITPLTDFHAALSKSETVRDHAAALYHFLIAVGIPEKLQVSADSLRRSDPAAASELEQLWSILIDALDELAAIMPDLACDSLIFTELLGILFDEIDIGRIPGTIDEVTAGDASLIRSAGRHVYVIGANEGLFPLAPSSDGILSDAEREMLTSLGIELSGGIEYQAADERFTFYRALTSASESVTIIWSGSDLSGRSMKPSIGVTRIMALFPKLPIKKFAELPLIERLEGSGNLLEFVAEAQGTELGTALREYAEASPLASRLAKLEIPLCEDEARLAEETCKLIAGGDLALTQARLDSYVLCHFSYYCKYILKLEEQRAASFDAGNIGTFVHHILELFVSRAEHIGELDDAAIGRMVDEIIADYMTTICRISDFKGSRLQHLFARLRRSSRLLCKNLAEEFSESEFSPAFFELPIRFPTPDEQTVEPLCIPLADGTNAYIYGIADRVDTLQRGDKYYVRVVDYKTGTKEFSLDNVAMGLDLQMLLYLFSIWKNGAKKNSSLDVPSGCEIVPAGVLYFGANVPTVTLDTKASADEVEREVASKLSRRGLLLDDREILSAMERELSGKYLPVRLKKDGSFSSSDALCSLDEFGKLLGSIEATIQDIGCEIKKGNAAAHPIRQKKNDACAWCSLRPVCRKKR